MKQDAEEKNNEKPREWRSAFDSWDSAFRLDRGDQLEDSRREFSRAADLFFEFSGEAPAIRLALLEYSNLMDAFSKVQSARIAKRAEDFDGSLALYSRSSEILRSTIHFAYLAPYISACATLEVASELEQSSEDCFAAHKNAIALLEQSKIALSLRDDRHPTIDQIDAFLKLAIGGALRSEGEALAVQQNKEASEAKFAQYLVLNNEYIELATKYSLELYKMDYFLIDDLTRVQNGAYVVSYPDADNLWLMNVGTNAALLKQLGARVVEISLVPGESYPFELKEMNRGRTRISYVDESTGREYDEGCLSLI